MSGPFTVGALLVCAFDLVVAAIAAALGWRASAVVLIVCGLFMVALALAYVIPAATDEILKREAEADAKTPAVPFLPGDTDDLVVTRYGAHGPAWDRIDVRVRPLVQPGRVPTPGPQPAAPVERGHRVPRMGDAR